MRKKPPLANVARRRASCSPLMQMNEYNPSYLPRPILQSWCDRTCLTSTDRGGHLGGMPFFQKQMVAP
jgi:hypothetical protein